MHSRTQMQRFARHGAMAMAILLASVLTGCTGITYSVREPRLSNERIKTRVRLNDERLETETEAGPFAVREVALMLADGSIVKPTISTRAPGEIREGTTVRIGVGTGYGYGPRTYTGAGVGRSYGGKVYPGPLVSQWSPPPPRDQQLWRLLVTLDTEPALEVTIPLGRHRGTREVEDATLKMMGVDELQSWELPTGETKTFRVAKRGEMEVYMPDAGSPEKTPQELPQESGE